MYFVLIIVIHYTHYLSSHWKSAHITTIETYLLADNWLSCRLPLGKHDFQQQHTNVLHTILRDPGGVSRAGKKGATKVFKHGRKSPWVPTLAGPFTNGQANAGSWLDIKKSFVLLCPIGEQYLLSSFRELVHDVYCLDHGLSVSKKWTQSGTSIQWISQKS